MAWEGDDGDECQGSPDHIISWTGPIVTFRWDNADNLETSSGLKQEK